ncbi:hypothetical protein N7524_008611 [Penicillium chrysogenum]|nr:hypothetical protein N7524_008611 [Penicillium chrysogenum]
MQKKEFMKWWLDTNLGQQKELRWDAKHASDAWEGFDQVAHYSSGLPKVMCQRCGTILDHPNFNPKGAPHGTSGIKRHRNGVNCFKGNTRTPQRSIEQAFKDVIVEHEDFQDLIRFARSAPSNPQFPSARTIQRRLEGTVKESEQSLLQKLPPNAKLSIALDCWTSPFQQAFMAVTCYFIEEDWNYREVLLGFEPLHGTHSGVNLSEVPIELFRKYEITDRALAVTTDNASNNTTMMASIQQSIDFLNLPNQPEIVRIPCIAHIIQLSLKDLRGLIKANPNND